MFSYKYHNENITTDSDVEEKWIIQDLDPSAEARLRGMIIPKAIW